MICEQTVKKFCSDFTKIENYEKAIADDTQTWHCHHKAETHFSDGTPRPANAQITKAELKALEMYYDRPPEELIFLTGHNHISLHRRLSITKGHQHTDTTKQKIAAKLNGRRFSEETLQKMSKSARGRKLSEETRRKMRESQKAAWAKRRAMKQEEDK